MEEVWKPISIYNCRLLDGSPRYQVSNLGRVRIAGYESVRRGMIQPRIMSSKSGFVFLRDDKGQPKRFSVSFLVAKEFVINRNGYPYVRHIDGDTFNNRADNLEWSIIRESNTSNRINAVSYKPVDQYSLDGELIKSFDSITEASRLLNIDYSTIIRCCNGQYTTAGGFVWRFSSAEDK